MIRHQLIGGPDVGRIDHSCGYGTSLGEEKSRLSLNLVRGWAAADESVDCPQSQANIKV